MTPKAFANVLRFGRAAQLLFRSSAARLTDVALTCGYFDQAHLAHALRRYIGRTARELQAGDHAAMSFLYKTHPGPGS